MITLLCVVTLNIYTSNKNFVEEFSKNSLEGKINNFVEEIEEEKSFVQNDILFLAKHKDILSLTKSPSSKISVINLFKRILLKRNYYKVLRIFTLDGKELIKVKKNNDDSFKVYPNAELQLKFHRNYLKRGINSKDDLFFGNPTLDMENKKITIPYEIHWRISKKIKNKSSKNFLLMINVDFLKLISPLWKRKLNKDLGIKLGNSQGDILIDQDTKIPFNGQSFLKVPGGELKALLENEENKNFISNINYDLNSVVGLKRFRLGNDRENFLILRINDELSKYNRKSNRAIMLLSLLIMGIVVVFLIKSFYENLSIPLRDCFIRINEISEYLKISAISEGVKTDFKESKDLKDLKHSIEEIMKAYITTRTDFLNQKNAIDEFALISETDYEGNLTYVNERFIKLTGYSKEELIGKNHRIVSSHEHRPLFWANFWKVVKNGEMWTGTIKNKKKDGSFYWVDTLIKPYLDNEGKIFKFASIRFDVTSKIHSLEKAKKAEQQKTNFLSIMSHEIRTPLNGLLGSIQLLEKSKFDESDVELLDTIEKSGTWLFNVVNDVLDITQIEEGVLTLENGIFNLREIIGSLESVFQPFFKDKKNSLKMDVAEDVPNNFIGDKVKLVHILKNFIIDSYKNSTDEEVHLLVQGKNTKDGKFKIEFEINDKRKGFSRDENSNIFNAFDKDLSAISKGGGESGIGTGLGLHICKKYIELMNGRIWVESKTNEGITFIIEITLEISEEEIKKAHTFEVGEIDPLTFLVVEDEPINTILLKKVLLKLGHNVVLAVNGLEGVEYASEQKFDVILMDVQMPIMDGLEATRTIREKYDPNFEIYIVGVSANVVKENIENAYKAGMDDFISKPYKVTKIHKVISDYLERKIKKAS